MDGFKVQDVCVCVCVCVCVHVSVATYSHTKLCIASRKILVNFAQPFNSIIKQRFQVLVRIYLLGKININIYFVEILYSYKYKNNFMK